MTDKQEVFTAAPAEGMDWRKDKPSKIVFVNNGHTGLALWWVGLGAWVQLQECGITNMEDLGLGPEPAGIEIWEGDLVADPPSWESGVSEDCSLVGKFRTPTLEEWEAIGAGQCPWDPAEWHQPEEKEGATP